MRCARCNKNNNIWILNMEGAVTSVFFFFQPAAGGFLHYEMTPVVRECFSTEKLFLLSS